MKDGRKVEGSMFIQIGWILIEIMLTPSIEKLSIDENCNLSFFLGGGG